MASMQVRFIRFFGLGAPASAWSRVSMLVYLARVRLAERVLLAWVREGWTHVALTGSPRVRVIPVMLPWPHGGAWSVDSKAARDLIVASMAQGVEYDAEEAPRAPDVAPELRAEIDVPRGQVS